MNPKEKIVILCDSFKGCLSSKEAGEAMAEGVNLFDPDIPTNVKEISDGGEGFLAAMARNGQSTKVICSVQDPLGNLIDSGYVVSNNRIIIESALTCGLALVPPRQRDPLSASSFGLGKMIAHALKNGHRNFILGIGGTATNDGGIGLLKALGFRFLDKSGHEIPDNVSALMELAEIDDSRVMRELNDAKFKVACDVTNPLTGKHGASFIYGPQKGADPATVKILDNCLQHFAEVTASYKGADLSRIPGCGAAGGIGFALVAFLNAKLQPGIDVMLDLIDFENLIKDTSLIITGEGSLDLQTLNGKVPAGILKRAAKYRVPVIAIGGRVEKKALNPLLDAGFQAIYASTPPNMPMEQALSPEIAIKNLRRTTSKAIQDFMEAKKSRLLRGLPTY